MRRAVGRVRGGAGAQPSHAPLSPALRPPARARARRGRPCADCSLRDAADSKEWGFTQELKNYGIHEEDDE